MSLFRPPAMLSALILVALTTLQIVAAFSGDLTYYGGAGANGACSSGFNYPGFTSVSMNNAQYLNGQACGGCVSACFTSNGRRQCFKAIVNNRCPECKFGDLDLGQSGDGRWPVTWKYIRCPFSKLIFRTQGSNPNYGKLKIEGGGKVLAVTCRGRHWTLSSDGYWIGAPSPGGPTLNCGFKCSIRFQYRGVLVRRIPGSLFGGGC